MSRRAPIITLHASRRGTGKSTIAVNMAVLAATSGLRVGLVDADLQAPALHLIFGLDTDELPRTLNHFLEGECPITRATVDMTARLGVPGQGALYLTPGNSSPSAIARITRAEDHYPFLEGGLRQLAEELDLDAVLVDAPTGLSEQALQSLASSDRLLIVLRPDHQNYIGTAIIVGVARELDPERLVLVVNEAPSLIDPVLLASEIERSFGHEVDMVLPHSDELSALGSRPVFALQYPGHPMTELYRRLVVQCIPEAANDTHNTATERPSQIP